MDNTQNQVIKKWNKKAVRSIILLILAILTYLLGGILVDNIFAINYLRWVPFSLVIVLVVLSFYFGIKSQGKNMKQLYKGNTLGLVSLVISGLILITIIFFFDYFIYGFATTSSW